MPMPLIALLAATWCDTATPAEVDLRPRFHQWGLFPKRQGSRGTCSIFAIVGVLEYEVALAGVVPPPDLSEEYLNWASHQTNGRDVDGSFFSDALNGLDQFGICREELMPYAAQFDAHATPSAQAREEAASRRNVSAHWIKEWDVNTGLTREQMAAIRASLAEGHPVAAGMRWPKAPVFGPDHVLQLPPGEVFDGHSVILVGYQDDPGLAGGGAFLFRNHAGTDWAEGGYARLPYAYVEEYTNDAVGLRVRPGK